MQMRRLLEAFALSALYVMMGGQVRGAQQPDPTWPCIQRKVPTLSLSQVWNGPELPDSAVSWSEESGISALVRELSARRMPLADAENTIVKFANSRSGTERSMELAMLAQGLFDHMNAERASVISGIARYAENQLAMAARLRAEASRLAELRAQPDQPCRVWRGPVPRGGSRAADRPLTLALVSLSLSPSPTQKLQPPG